ncbi:CBS domain-containing protein [Dactylosporangium aurantiacum]|uniref:CBS domain-containing protein n=1 Tax=Dactylosporangium aurantiacum TaxID=35754 RepID=A0A9Q9IRX0_9ACTN|nr:putative nucleotidyltransferase substrate binding domain-containing protein [Dactylosporangium aurantiacum]MDG6110137.1 putative nucleotidyltransferase substrate binding domain-containing protein [Dactylosporangium aurantiacum]UWZ57883.1 CBS domain-containing protein [Dactylosporangium aurantiacum]
MQELVDFLGGQPPFDALDPRDLARVAAGVEVEHLAAGATVTAGGVPACLWVVRSGALEMLAGDRVVDLLGPGDTIGPGWPPAARVRAREDSVCLRVPDPRALLTAPERLVRDAGLRRADRPLTRLVRPIVWCDATDRVRDVAARIGAAGLSCALVRAGDHTGIVTDLDFRAQVATGRVGPDAPVRALATVPALTVGEDATQEQGLLRMVEHGVHHLVVVDGAGRPTGVLRAADLAGAEVRDPLLVRSAIDNASDVGELAAACRLLPAMLVELCDDAVPATRVGAVHAAVLDAAIRRALRLQPHPALDGVRHSWVVLGSLARQEPLPLSDVDTALVWADPPPGGAGPDGADRIRADAREVLRVLQRCGFTLCANGANAHNPVFSRARSGWVAAARGWQHDPTQANALLLSAMVADSRPLTDPELGGALSLSIRSHTRTSQFLRALLDEALSWRPPTGFIRDFVVHHSGEHRGQLDLKPGGLTPVVALARWIAIAAGDASGTTVQRLHRGAALGLLTTDEADTLAGGFENVYHLLLHHEVRALRGGGTPSSTFIAPKDLDSLTRRHLRETFRAIAFVQSRVDRAWLDRLPG